MISFFSGLTLTELLPGDEETVRLSGGKSLSVCGGTDQRLAPHCMQYDYQSTHLLETFVLDKDVYQVCHSRLKGRSIRLVLFCIVFLHLPKFLLTCMKSCCHIFVPRCCLHMCLACLLDCAMYQIMYVKESN